MILLLVSCSGTATIAKSEAPGVTLTLDTLAFDPHLDGAPTVGFTVTVDPFVDSACTPSLRVENGLGQVATLTVDKNGNAAWQGLADDGLAFDVGRFTAVAVGTCDDGGVGSATIDGWIVRLGLASIDFVDSGDDAQVPLAFHKLDVVTREVSEIDVATPEYRLAPFDAASDLDEDDGTPRVPPAIWTNPDMPPWGAEAAADYAYNVPAAYVATGLPRLAVVPGTTTLSTRTGGVYPAIPADAPPLRLAGTGLTPVADGAFLPGVQFDGDFLQGVLGRLDQTIEWTWEVYDGEAWVPVPGSLTTSHRIYQTAGTSQWRDGSALGFAPPTPWIGVLEDLEPALAGQAPDTVVVLDAIRDWLHWNDYLIYNPNDGAYSSYVGPYIYWEYTWSLLSDWLDRDNGVELYCHSVSCLFSVLAGAEGVYAPQQVLGVGFYTNLTRAAGSEDWINWSFNSHSVVSPDDGATIWDASIDLDGDEDPLNEPATVLEPKGLSYEEYTTRLTGDPISIVNSGLCYVE